MKTPEEIADFIWGQHDAEFSHEETMIDDMTWEDFVAWIKEDSATKATKEAWMHK